MIRSTGRARTAPLFALTLLPLMVSATARAGGVALPTGGKVVVGSATIGASSATTTTINQSSSKAIINWNGFSIGQGGAVQFNNGSGATLNRVTGTSISSIDGLLSATGSVYLINPNGVIIGKSGEVNVGGTFVASTLDLANTAFMNGDLTFTGSSTTGVINLGKIGSLGGDVALIGAVVENDGTISAANGTVGLAAGYGVLIRDATLDDGKFSVLVGGSSTSVTNKGTIVAADAELRAEQGNVYALAGNTAGVVRATGVEAGDGKIWLVADGGALEVAGTLDAQGANGTAGQIETSGQTVKVDAAAINAHGGRWTLDPLGLVIDSAAASTIDAALNAGTAVYEATNGDDAPTGAGTPDPDGAGDILVTAPITWKTTADLTLSSYHGIDINAAITASNGGSLTLITDNTGLGNGGALTFGSGGSVQFTGTRGGLPTGSLSIGVGLPADEAGKHGTNLNAYTLVADLATLSGDIAADNGGHYALASNIDAGGTSYYSSPLTSTITTAFAGTFEGLGNAISNLTIKDATNASVGLFGMNAGVVQDIGLINPSVTSSEAGARVGALVGYNSGSVLSSYAYGGSTAAVRGGEGSFVGGLVGVDDGVGGTATISDSYASVAVTDGAAVGGGAAATALGGLVGDSTADGGTAIIQQSFAAGAVSGGDGAYVGGLVGLLAGADAKGVRGAGEIAGSGASTITDAYAMGPVTGGRNAYVGGLVGALYGGAGGSANINDAYATGRVGGATGAQLGGLVGQYQARGGVVNTNNGFFDLQATGQAGDGGSDGTSNSDGSSIGPATGLTTAQLQGGDPFGDGPWTAGGGFYPYLTAMYSTAPQVISGVAYGDQGSTPLAGSAVSILNNGTMLSQALTGSSGDYYVVQLPHAPAISGATLLYTTADGTPSSTVTGARLVSISGTSPSADIWGHTLFGQITATSLSTAPATASAYLTGSALLSTATGSYTAVANGVAALPNLGYIADTPTFNFDENPLTPAFYLENATGDIVVDPSSRLTVAGGTALTLVAPVGAITFDSPVTVGTAANGPTAASGGALHLSGAPSFAQGANITYVSDASGDPLGVLTMAGANYTLLNSLDELGGIGGGDYALVSSLVQPSGTTIAGSVLEFLTGTLDGLGNTITNLTLVPDGHDSNLGLIGFITATGTVRNIGLVGGSVSSSSFGAIGDLAGVNQGSIVNSYATGAVSGGMESTVGGLVGINVGSISNSHASGAVTNGGAGASALGGLVGYQYSYESGASIQNSYATGAVTGGPGDTVGGLVGLDVGTYDGRPAEIPFGGVAASGEADIENSYATGAVSGGDYAGGLVGAMYGGYTAGDLSGVGRVVISNSYATGSVSGATYVGGLVGSAEAAVGFVNIDSSYATGAVSGGVYAGGLLGILDANQGAGLINNSYATGSVTDHGGGESMLGGLVGYVTADGSYDAQINDSYATGAVSGGDGSYVGGLVGLLAGVDVQNLGAGEPGTFTMTDAYATGAVSGGASSYVGGLIGVVYGGQTPADYGNVALDATYATGVVHGGTGAQVGGLVGQYQSNDGLVSVTSSYFDTQTTGQANDGGTDGTTNADGIPLGSGAGLTTAELQGTLQPGMGYGWAVGPGLYPYLTDIFPDGVQALTTTAYSAGATPAPGAQVGFYSGGALLGGGTASVGADGSVYQVVAAGTVASGAGIGDTLTLAGATSPSGAAFTDAPVLSGMVFTVPSVSSGQLAAATHSATYTGLLTQLGATFGPTDYAALSAGLTGASLNISAAGAFTVDAPLSGTGSETIASAGPLSIANSLTSTGGDITLTSGGAGGLLNLAADLSSPSGVVTLTSSGAISQTAGTITAATLTGSSGGATTLNGANAVASLGGFTSGGDFAFNNGATLTAAGPLTVTGSAELSSANNVDVTGTISAADVTLFAGDAGSGTGTVAFSGPGSVTATGVAKIFYNPTGGYTGPNASTQTYAAGGTSYTNPYSAYVTARGGLTAYMLVNTLSDLQAVGDKLAGIYAQYGDIDASGAAAGLGFVPIGTGAATFTGVYNGQGHTISGLTEAPPVGATYVGMFGAVGAGGQIENLSLTAPSVRGYGYTGGLVGDLFGTLSAVSVISGDVTGLGGTGGVVGVVEAGAGVTNASTSAAVSSASGNDVGGLAGASFGSITDSSATGNVTASIGSHVGALIGSNYGAVSGVSAGGAVTGAEYVGGLIGLNYAAVSGSNATGPVTGTEYVGGLIGWNDAAGTISGSSATGAVVASAAAGGAASGDGDYAGGLIGVNKGQLANVSAQLGAVSGTDDVGGLVGLNQGVVESTVAGAVNASGAVSGRSAVGGLVGWNDAGATITDGVSSGAVSASGNYGGGLVGVNYGSVNGGAASGLVIGAEYTGGFAGWNATGAAISDAAASGATVSGTSYVGGFAGWQSMASLTSDSATSAVVDSGDYAGGLVGVNQGSILGSSALGSTVSGGNIVGGLVGLNQGVIGVASTGAVRSDVATAAVTGASTIGGLVGYNDQNGSISDAYASGAIVGTTDVSGEDVVGGLVGINYGRIADTYATGSVSGTNGVGGLIGVNQPSGSVATSYATGAVRASGAVVGGVFGVNGGEVTYVYGFPGLSGQALLAGEQTSSASSATALSNSQEDDSAAYDGFDFSKTWQANPDGPPTLRASSAAPAP